MTVKFFYMAHGSSVYLFIQALLQKVRSEAAIATREIGALTFVIQTFVRNANDLGVQTLPFGNRLDEPSQVSPAAQTAAAGRRKTTNIPRNPRMKRFAMTPLNAGYRND